MGTGLPILVETHLGIRLPGIIERRHQIYPGAERQGVFNIGAGA